MSFYGYLPMPDNLWQDYYENLEAQCRSPLMTNIAGTDFDGWCAQDDLHIPPGGCYIIDDQQKEKPVLERKREWEHSDQKNNNNEDCYRKDKKIYTNPESVPGICRGYNCENEEWYSKGIITRDKSSKQIVDRESDRTKEETSKILTDAWRKARR